MTNEEAIETLQEKSLERCEAFGFDCGDCDKCEVTIAYDMAIKALKKQIPEKPISEERYYICPCCRGDLGVSDDDIFVYELPMPKYCDNCGQALDWSDTDDSFENYNKEE